VRACTHTYVHTFILVHLHSVSLAKKYICIYIYIYIYIYPHAHTHLPSFAKATLESLLWANYSYSQIQNVHTHTHTHTHTHQHTVYHLQPNVFSLLLRQPQKLPYRSNIQRPLQTPFMQHFQHIKLRRSYRQVRVCVHVKTYLGWSYSGRCVIKKIISLWLVCVCVYVCVYACMHACMYVCD
jgi:hypothetical protein